MVKKAKALQSLKNLDFIINGAMPRCTGCNRLRGKRLSFWVRSERYCMAARFFSFYAAVSHAVGLQDVLLF